jgi:hypothetical protein
LGTHLATLNGSVDGIECGLCPCVLPTANSLQTHLIEHTFAGCKAFTCYLCSAIFTAPTGLQAHMTVDHSAETPPYDCPRPGCQAKFFFTAELDRHTLEHQGQDVLANVSIPYNAGDLTGLRWNCARLTCMTIFDRDRNDRERGRCFSVFMPQDRGKAILPYRVLKNNKISTVINE